MSGNTAAFQQVITKPISTHEFYVFFTYLQNSWNLPYKINSQIPLRLYKVSSLFLYSRVTRREKNINYPRIAFLLTLCFVSIPFYVLIGINLVKIKHPQQWKRFFSTVFPKDNQDTASLSTSENVPLSHISWWNSLIICCHVFYKFWWSAFPWTIPVVLVGYRWNFSLSWIHIFDSFLSRSKNPTFWKINAEV